MRRVLYFAPGSGLGHLNRALALTLALRPLGVEAEIVTNSPFAEGVATLARCRITRIPESQWLHGARAYARECSPSLIVADTFPFGLRGEWIVPPAAPLVYVARRLRLENYPHTGRWDSFAAIIAAEPLSGEHDAVLAESSASVVRLPGPIRLEPGLVPVPIPGQLEHFLDSALPTLVVHSGPVEELHRLIALARHNQPPVSPIAALTPWKIEDDPGCPCFEYFPFCNLAARAARVVSGAGYNIVADMWFHRERHTAIPFPRKFDDQAARLAAMPDSGVDGTAPAAQAIAELL
jgi:hypothetical protein